MLKVALKLAAIAEIVIRAVRYAAGLFRELRQNKSKDKKNERD